MKPVRIVATLLAGLALTTAPILTACSQSSDGSVSSDSTASDNSAESDKSDDKDSDTKNNKKDAGADKTDRGSDKAFAGASASAAQSDLPKAAPAGYQEITVLTVNPTLAAPKGWQAASLDETSSIYCKTPDDGFIPYPGSASVSKITIPTTEPLTEAELSPALTSILGATSTGYFTERTVNGETAVFSYTANIEGRTINGALIATPTKEKGKYAIISISTNSSGQSVDELKTTILETAH